MRSPLTGWLCLSLLAGCVPMEPSGKPFAPVVERTAVPQAPRARPDAPDAPEAPRSAPSVPSSGSFDFEAEDRTLETPGTGGSADPNALQARLLGLPPDAVRASGAGEAQGAIQSLEIAPAPAPIWDPTVPLPQISFGIRVLAVVLDVQPPRAMIALPGGEEIVVQPGSMLPAAGLVVLAIGRDAVQVAKITPSGYYATVQTETVQSMYRASAREGSAGP